MVKLSWKRIYQNKKGNANRVMSAEHMHLPQTMGRYVKQKYDKPCIILRIKWKRVKLNCCYTVGPAASLQWASSFHQCALMA